MSAGPPHDGGLSLYEHAKRLLRQHPDGPLPDQGRPFPDHVAYYGRDRSLLAGQAGARQTRTAIGAYFDGVSDYARLYRTLALVDSCPSWYRLPSVLQPVTCDVDRGRLRDLGRRLVRTGEDRQPVQVGLALLQGVAEPEDLDCLSALAILGDSFSPAVVEILQRMPEPDMTLWWIARRTTEWARVYPVRALCGTSRSVIKAWLLRHAVPGESAPLPSYYAGTVAVSCDLRAAIQAPHPDEALLDGAEAILHAMNHAEGLGLGLRGYRDAVPVLRRFLQLRDSPPLRNALAQLLSAPPGT
ncbi:hypothetical protein SMC26_08565 [Actinomadura fulvescens]|uniref:HEAT repeat domain-containing protein n=1 Tax=Actinomadura fulvescens TaxID=46160 RepID=A0ABP6D455_9ACTN